MCQSNIWNSVRIQVLFNENLSASSLRAAKLCKYHALNKLTVINSRSQNPSITSSNGIGKVKIVRLITITKIQERALKFLEVLGVWLNE